MTSASRSFPHPPVRVIYSDLDGTMVGPKGCFFRSQDRSLTLEPARALVDLLAADVSLVLVSGRTQAQLLEACQIFGADGYVAELGAVVGWDRGRSRHLIRGAMPEDLTAIPEELVAALLSRYAGRLEFHDPWHIGHEMDVMVRGQVDPVEVNAWLAGQGAGWLRLHDNGILPPRPTNLTVPVLHVYHLVADGIDKGQAIAFDLNRRGLAAQQAIAIGDSVSDLAMAAYVERLYLVANGMRSAAVRAALARVPNVTVTTGAVGQGWSDAVREVLAG